jgi:acyl-coenzyme A thioesterase PaaI-like protein
VLALLDTTGAMAAWGAVGPGRFKASSAAIQAQILGPVAGEDLVGYGRVVQRDGELFWADVEIAAAAGGHLQARGTVVYRIVT